MHHTAENALAGREGSGEKATVITYPDRFSRQEILELAEAAGYRVQEVITQKQIIRSEYGIGVGKAQELQEIVAENGSKTVIIDESVTSSQANNLSKVTQAEVVDRERLVLNIFARRANTTEAKLQVRLAELRYEMPRAKDAVRFSVKGERAGFSGMGESAVDVKIRALKRQMVLIGQKLEKSRTNRELYTVERRKLNMPFVSLAGYTSSGKTTLFNRLASESKEESPKLFTTLSTTTRAVAFADSRKRIMLSDTVGFISRLPPYMFESFKSTLDELRYADLILLLIDAGEPVESIRIKLESCRETLFGLEVDPKKTLLVLNKIDRIEDERKRRIEQEPIFSDFASITISAKRGDGLHQLKNRIVGLVFPPKPPI
ncbi:MAG: GTPase HflX [Nitrososphaerota archaeon]|jgi:GTP-binding protein HflX|nr:GTPase HflX [Nitrososphaerota archaeon]MDG6946017.1 GTPase HflX [Nitrososphaerota archaeon]MDG6947551.1 GTPase HflX [Nitrososphaerota archaeon]